MKCIKKVNLNSHVHELVKIIPLSKLSSAQVKTCSVKVFKISQVTF